MVCRFSPRGNEREKFFKGKGCKVVIKFRKSSKFGRTQTTLRNVNEIHRGYRATPWQKKEVKKMFGYVPSRGDRIAFESDIHHQGVTYAQKDIESLKLSDEKQVGSVRRHRMRHR